ncbi:DUF3383 family protein [Peribacillus castrilensis]|uniref:DUF3383 family protein n=1 Tax=Peribacillus castrilensis TaxID=2897690 RepID=UPI003D2B0375
MPLQDVTVTIDIIKPAAYVGFGKPLILAEKAGNSTIKDYKDIVEVKVDFAEGTEAYEKAMAVFEQEHRPETLSIATYDPAGTEIITALDALEKYYDNDWVFALVAEAVVSDQIALADFVESKGYKKLAVMVSLEADRNGFKQNAYDHTIVFFHPVIGEHADAALIGELGNQVVGSITWKFKTLKGITPIEVTPEELQAIHNDGAIAYVTKAGKPQTSEGIVASGEYIDVMHGKDWIKFNMEASIQNGLANSPKVPYNNTGISLLESQATTVLQRGHSQGIIDSDDNGNPLYTVTAKPRSEMSAEDRANRKYGGLSFSYRAQDAVHESDIKGEILA